MIIIAATPRLSASTRMLVSGPIELLNNEGINRAITERSSRMALRAAWRGSKRWMPFRMPPSIKDMPITSRIFPRMEPVIEAFTSSSSPSRMATIVMINSAALPRVAFSSPPTRGPV